MSQACHFDSARAEGRSKDESFEWGGIEVLMLQGDVSACVVIDMFLGSIFKREPLKVPSKTADHHYPGTRRDIVGIDM